MLILSRVCAEFRDKSGRPLLTVTPERLLSFIEAPEAVREDPLFSLLISDGSLEAVQSVPQRKTLENDPVAGTTAEGKKDPAATADGNEEEPTATVEGKKMETTAAADGKKIALAMTADGNEEEPAAAAEGKKMEPEAAPEEKKGESAARRKARKPEPASHDDP